MAVAPRVFTEKYAEMTHGKTRYWEAGSGYPTILIHGAGWTSGCENWAGSIGPLSEKLRVLAIDCLNWGLGDVLDQEFSFAYLVDHVREFMDVLGIEKANFVGHSMGGWIVTLLSYESPDRCNKVVNVAGGGAATRPLQNMVEFKVPAADALRQQFANRKPAGGLTGEDMAATFIKKIDLPGHGEAFAKVMRHMTNPTTRQRYNTLRRLPHIKVPTLVVWGRNDPVNKLEECGEPTAKGIPGAKLIVYDGVGHGVPQENPEQFNKDVLAFLAG
ncbi:MAG TPA: alpha/beta hydrolase [Chloroflexota bacterium]|jgi:pimeloyl-ACP methyl ester carboxylesterase|nr:alpha/beta hydrolase [Chloroflexota bacterium]